MKIQKKTLVIISLVLGATIIFLGYIQTISVDIIASIAIQVVSLLCTIVLTYLPTKYFSEENERKIAENRAGIALRHTLALDRQMRQTSEFIYTQGVRISEDQKQGKIEAQKVIGAIDGIRQVHDMQFTHIQATASDWQDILPKLTKEEDDNGK